MCEAVALGDESLEKLERARKLSDPDASKAEVELSRGASYRQIELIHKIAEWKAIYAMCADDFSASEPGGWTTN